jgi:hypothetical protein
MPSWRPGWVRSAPGLRGSGAWRRHKGRRGTGTTLGTLRLVAKPAIRSAPRGKHQGRATRHLGGPVATASSFQALNVEHALQQRRSGPRAPDDKEARIPTVLLHRFRHGSSRILRSLFHPRCCPLLRCHQILPARERLASSTWVAIRSGQSGSWRWKQPTAILRTAPA